MLYFQQIKLLINSKLLLFFGDDIKALSEDIKVCGQVLRSLNHAHRTGEEVKE